MSPRTFRSSGSYYGQDYSLTAMGIVFLVVLVLVLTLFLGPVACTDEASTFRVLSSQGYTNIEITGWRPAMGDKGDFYSTGFEATSPNGHKVSGAVTSGLWFKGNTIRLD